MQYALCLRNVCTICSFRIIDFRNKYQCSSLKYQKTLKCMEFSGILKMPSVVLVCYTASSFLFLVLVMLNILTKSVENEYLGEKLLF